MAHAPRSARAYAKETAKRTEDGLPVHGFQSLMADLGTACLNTAVTALDPHCPLTITTRPTPVQRKAFDLLGVPPTGPGTLAGAAGRTR